jgi:glycosyltransferase involved in cell wall biosynthesis
MRTSGVRTWLDRWLPPPHVEPAPITVVVTVYRTEAFLADCLASILGQSLRDIQVVVVDDGSPGAVRQIVRHVAGDDRRVTLRHHRVNRGLLAARLTGVRMAASPYLAFVDSDDVVDPRFLELMHRAAECHGADITECAISMIELDQNRLLINRGGAAHQDDAAFAAFLGGKMSNTPTNKLIRTACWRAAVARLGRKIGHLSFAEDLLLMFFITLSAGRYAHIPDPLYTYIRRPGSLTTAEDKRSSEVRISSLRKVFNAIAPTLTKSPLPAHLKRQFLEREFFHLRRAAGFDQHERAWETAVAE